MNYVKFKFWEPSYTQHRLLQQDNDRDGVACATSSTYRMSLSVKSLPLLEQCPRVQTVGKKATTNSHMQD